MTDKILDTDLIKKEMYDRAVEILFDDANNNLTIDTVRNMIKQNMSEDNKKILTPAEPQQSIFDADGWSSDFSIIQDYIPEGEPYLTTNDCRLAWAEGFGEEASYNCIGDFVAFDEEYFKSSVKKWRPFPKVGDNVR